MAYDGIDDDDSYRIECGRPAGERVLHRAHRRYSRSMIMFVVCLVCCFLFQPI